MKIRNELKPIVPNTMEAAVAVLRRRRTGTAVESLRAEAGSSEVAMATAPAPAPPAAVAAKSSLVLARQKPLAVISLSVRFLTSYIHREFRGEIVLVSETSTFAFVWLIQLFSLFYFLFYG